MICNSVMPCLSSGLANNDRITSMFVSFPGFFAIFLENGDKPYTKAVKHDILFNF